MGRQGRVGATATMVPVRCIVDVTFELVFVPSTQVSLSHLRPIPPYAAMGRVQLMVGVLLEIKSADRGVWNTGVVLNSRLKHTHPFKWSSYPPLSDTDEEMQDPEYEDQDQRQETKPKHESEQKQQLGPEPEPELSSENRALACNPILIPCTPSSGSTSHAIVYLLHSTDTTRGLTKRRKITDGRVIYCDSSMIAAGLIRPCLWWDSTSSHWYTVAIKQEARKNKRALKGAEARRGAADKELSLLEEGENECLCMCMCLATSPLGCIESARAMR